MRRKNPHSRCVLPDARSTTRASAGIVPPWLRQWQWFVALYKRRSCATWPHHGPCCGCSPGHHQCQMGSIMADIARATCSRPAPPARRPARERTGNRPRERSCGPNRTWQNLTNWTSLHFHRMWHVLAQTRANGRFRASLASPATALKPGISVNAFMGARVRDCGACSRLGRRARRPRRHRRPAEKWRSVSQGLRHTIALKERTPD